MKSRVSNLKNLLLKDSLDAALISSVADIIYLTDFPYFSGDLEREAFLFITKKNNYILTDARYSHAARTKIKDFKLLEISGESNIEKTLSSVISSEKIEQVGIDSGDLTVFEHKKIKKLIKKFKHFDLSSLRKIKDQKEINSLEKACSLGDNAFTQLLKKIKKGITEKELAFELESSIKKNGAEISFSPIVAFEENAAIPHHKTGNRKLNINEFVLLDFGVKYDNYCSDMTRTICFGKATSEKKRLYQTVLDAQQKSIEYLEKNIKEKKKALASSVDKIARDYIISHSFPTIPHSLGHGIGLQVHEAPHLSPKSKDILKNGMVFSIEPGIYLNDLMGVRIEDLISIQNNNTYLLTKSPKNLIEL